MLPETPIEATGSALDVEHECARTRERLALYLRGGASAEQHVEFRSHRKVCPACARTFREALVMRTELSLRRRETEREEQRAQRRAQRRATAIEGSDTHAGGMGRRRRNAHLRLFMMPAFAVFIMLGVYPASRNWAPPRVALSVTEGRVIVSGETLTAGAEPRTLQRGDWCVAGSGAGGELVLSETRLHLEPGTRVLIEDSFDLRVRLQGGRIAIEGPCVVTTEAGVVEVSSGTGSVALLAEGLEVHSRTGAWSASNSRGTQLLAAGETVLLDLP